jgi:capsular exopolysaccharide synthesis family protein
MQFANTCCLPAGSLELLSQVMLHVGKDSRLTNLRNFPGSVLTPAEVVGTWKAFARRQMSVLLFLPVLSVAVALLYLATATPKYTAEAVLLAEPKRSDGAAQSSLGEVGSAASILDNQIEILKSEKIALSIINTLQLTNDPEFVGRGPLGRALALVTPSEPDTEFSLTRRALGRFVRRLTIKRVGLSYTIAIQFEASSPERAAQIANAVAEAYTIDQMYTNYEAARQTTEWLQGRVDALRSKASDAQKAVADYKATHDLTNQVQSELRELEISAQSYRRLYDTFLQRYRDSAEQETSPASSAQARLMTVASPPLEPSSPKTLLVLVLSIAGGIVVGIGVGLVRDVSDLSFRTRDKVLVELHADCIGVIPAVVADSSAIGRPNPKPMPVRAKSRTIACTDHLIRTIADTPCSRFSESFRSVKLAVDTANRGAKRSQVIGITSALPSEGKSTVAASLAQLIAQGGSRAILLDCDLRNPTLSSSLAPDAMLSLLDVTSGRAKLDDATWIDSSTHLHFLPATNSGSRLAYTSEVLASDEMAGLFKVLRESYEYVIVDLSPIAPFVDVRAAAHLMDLFILVIEWGRTNSDAVKQSLDVAGEVYGKLIGVTLNKANVKELKRYGDTFESYHQQYSENSGWWK